MRPAASVLKTRGHGARKIGGQCAVLIGATLLTLCSILPTAALAQVPEFQRSPLAPPINHETGRIEEVITAADDGYRFRANVLMWRSMRIVVAGASDESRAPGDNLDVIVYRSDVNGYKVLRFESSLPAANENVVDADAAASTASITLGTARIEESLSAESDGYRFVGYFVAWHNQRVFVVDPKAAPARAPGETINFRVLRSGTGASQRLSFSL
jgi:hypothetical protein